MKIREMNAPGDMELIKDYIPEGVQGLMEATEILVFGAFADDEEEFLTTSPDEEVGEDTTEDEDNEDNDIVIRRRKVCVGEFLGFAIFWVNPRGIEVLWLYTLPDCRTLGTASELLNEIFEYALNIDLNSIALLVPDTACFPAVSDDDAEAMEKFTRGCNFELCKRYSYKTKISSENKSAGILNRLISKKGRRYSQRILLKLFKE
ncbi:MAG: GNAT family N-acetyltransferase [Lachnospiraceae bacterium]|nr:GNAT family N-acetyltransferase [Lachnospiraceae bacterium]